MIFKPMTPQQLARNDRFFMLVVLIGLVFLLYHFYLSARSDIPKIGWSAYLLGPMFTHKASELLLLLMWLPVAWVYNYENAGCMPKAMPAPRYARLLLALLYVAPWQIVLAVYAWTIVNLGTSPLTTDYRPLVFGDDAWVWRYYLGTVILAGIVFVPIAVHKLMRLQRA